ncbi:MAG: MFS transporter [Acidobacteriota bacterium]
MNRETGPVEAETGNRTVLIIFTLFGVLFLATVDNQLLIPILPTLGREFQVSMATLAWLFSGYALAAAGFSLFLGPFIDRFGRLIFLRTGLVLFMAIALCTYISETYYQLLGLRVCAGLAGGLLSTCTSSLVGDLFSYQRRGRIMGIVLSSYFAALILGIPLAAWIAELSSWRNIYLFSSMLGLLLTACSFWIPSIPLPPEPSLSLGSYLRTYPFLLKKREARGAVVTSFCVSGATLAFLTFISDHLDLEFGLQPVQISWLFITAGVAAALGSPLSGWMSDRFTKRRVFLAANTLLAVSLLALHRLPWGGLLFGLFFLISLCVSFRQTALHTLQTELVLTEKRGSFIALRNGFSQLGISISVLVSGSLYSTMGYGGVTTWAAILTLLSCLVFYWTVQEPGKTE